MNTDYLKGMPELEIVIAAKNGDKNATEWLWLKYRKAMTNALWGVTSLSLQEKESESAYIFMHKLKNVFDPEKVRKTPEEWEFFSMLYQGMIGRRAKIRKERVFLSYDESEVEFESESKTLNAEKVCLFNKELFSRYNPEDAVLDLDFKTKARQIGESIDRLQKIRMDYSRYIQDLFGSLVNEEKRNGETTTSPAPLLHFRGNRVSQEDCKGKKLQGNQRAL
jgi:hypothetical protein